MLVNKNKIKVPHIIKINRSEWRKIIGMLLEKLSINSESNKFVFIKKHLATIKLKNLNYNTSSIRDDFFLEMGNISKLVLSQLDIQSIIEKRIENYKFLSLLLNNIEGIKKIYPKLSNGIVPLAMPIFVKKNISTKIIRCNIGVYCWPRLPREVINNEQFYKSVDLSKKIVLLPIHQSLTKKNIQYIFKIVKEIVLFEKGNNGI